jgi:hypothetical protein
MIRARTDARLIKAYAKNILALYLDADAITRAAGAVWYAVERERCASFGAERGISGHLIAGAASAISPGMRWENVFSHLAALIANPNARVPTYSKEFVRRAVRILNGESPATVLSGPKVTAFYGLLSGADLDAVVVDGHAFNIARGQWEVFRKRPGYSPTAGSRINTARYRRTAQAYREVAEITGDAAHAIQATTWIHWRNITKRGTV